MRILSVVALLLGLQLSGCSELRSIDADNCGNQILDSREDCDTFSAFGEGSACGAPSTANSCFYICEGESSCPTGWGCGDDGRCRQALGQMQVASGSPWRFKANGFKLGDVDGDGNPDLIGGAESTLSIRFGTEFGEFPTEISVKTRRPVAPTIISDLNGDGLLDVVVPIFSGLFTMLGQTDQSLQSIAYAPFEVESLGETVRLQPVESNTTEINTESLAFFGNVMELLFASGDRQILPGGYTVDDIAGRIPVADVDQAANGRDEWALAFRTNSSVYLYSVQGSGPLARTVLRQEIAIPGQGRVNLGAQFADVDGNGQLDVMISIVDASSNHRVAVAYTNLSGEVDATATIEPIFNEIAGVWPLASTDLDGDGKSDYVGIRGIFLADFSLPFSIRTPLTVTPVAFATGPPWSASAIGDYNGDGTPDVAVGIEDTDGLEFFLGSGTVLFNRFHLETDSPATILRSADYDGDFVTDLAFVQSGQGEMADELLVSYGETSGGPGDAISMGVLGTIKQVEQTTSIIDIDSIDVIKDLIVVSESFPDAESVSIAGMVGSSERRMLSPFTFGKPESQTGDTPSRVLLGDFVALDGETVSAKDVIVIALPQDLLNTDGPVRYDLWMLPGEGTMGGISAIDTTFSLLPEELFFESDCSEWAVGDLDGDGIDEIIGLDGNLVCNGRGSSAVPRLVLIHPSEIGGESVEPDVLAVVGGFTSVESLEAIDVDNDGDLDIVVLFAGEVRRGLTVPSESPADGSGIVVYWNEGGAILPTNYSSFQIPEAFRILDFATIHLNGDATPELAVMTNVGIYAASLDTQTSQYSAPTLLIDSVGLGRFDVADVNGDGLDDIAWTEGADVNIFLGQSAPPLGEASEAGQ